jgi:hypothetical protein
LRATLWRTWLWWLAALRLSPSAVCEVSRGRGLLDDFHDYPDSTLGEPDHFVMLTCKRCGKEFMI